MKAILAMLVLAAGVGQAEGNGLAPGSPAPKVEVKSWIKGKHIDSLDPSRVYVVEFWATWCGPCIQATPHLTKLAQQFKGVDFLGVSIWEDGSKVKKFVDDMGSKMDYNVAYSGDRDGMAATWMGGAEIAGLPTAFIVKRGIIQWIGHPESLDGPLSKVVDGTFDLSRAKREFEEASAGAKRRNELLAAVDASKKLHASGQLEEARKALARCESELGLPKQDAEVVRGLWVAEDDPQRLIEHLKQFTASQDENLQVVPCYVAFLLVNDQRIKNAKELATSAFDFAVANAPNGFLVQYYACSFYHAQKSPSKGLAAAQRALALLDQSVLKNERGVKQEIEGYIVRFKATPPEKAGRAP